MVCLVLIKIKPEIKSELDELKKCKEESYYNIVERLIQFYYKHKDDDDGIQR